ncbi:MAG TPA: helix-turn-helix domain-containing protein [Nitrospirota bacterium]|jgi:predicted transcriptional regulator
MGIEEARRSAAITKNIEQALENKNLTRNELATRASIAKSTLYRNMNRPENFTIREAGEIAKALDLGLIDILKETA